MITIICIIFILLLTFAFSLLYIVHVDKLAYRRLERVKNFDLIVSVLNYNMEKAYDIIHKDRILIYSLEATKLNEQEFQQIAVDFSVLVLNLLGPTLTEELIYTYGDEETLYFNISEYFNTKFDDDEIRKTAQDNLMEQELKV